MLKAKFKLEFFDSKAVISATDKATRRVLSKFGAYVRRSAKSSIRKRKRFSEPGKPPSSHTGKLKKFIYFGYEPINASVVVGPVQFSGKGPIPKILEHGGSEIVRRKRRGKTTRTRAVYKARPFMGPALEKELPKLPAMWRDSVK